VRDPNLQEAFRRLAAEAATRFTSLVATGEELPFDVAENPGEHTFYRYVPLTGRFVRAHADELRSLPAFGPACSAVDAGGIAAPYLEARGESVPEDEVERAERMLIAFIARLWEGSAEFTIDKPRLDAAIRELDVEVQEAADADVLMAPLVGLQMPLARLELPSGVRIVRADTVEAPIEATRSEGMQRNAWDPQFLALAEREDGPGGSAPAMELMHDLISILRLFKEGGVGLGSHAFTPTGEGTWRRIPTGVPATRPGGYRLSEAEAEELAEFARRLEARPDPDGSLAWAVSRFEMGCDRPTALGGVSDHLLAMRALFEGSGPVGANLPMRAAALIAEARERPEAYEKLQAAFELERAMMAGREFDLGAATGLAAWLEDAARAIVRGAALGEHGSDVAASADESLVASGLEAGEGSVEQMGEADEWDPLSSEDPEPQDHPAAEAERSTPADEEFEPIRIRARAQQAEQTEHEQIAGDRDTPAPGQSPADRSPCGSLGAEDVSRIDSEPSYEDGLYYDADEDNELEQTGAEQGGNHRDTRAVGQSPTDREPGGSLAAEGVSRNDEEETTVRNSTELDWLSEVSGGDRGETLEWPAPRERSHHDTEEEPLEEPRVRHLFPVPDDADWEIGELDYDRDRTRVS
jgi:hypothetical protein